jgi:hypothetical protein
MEGWTNIRERKNQTIRNAKLDSSVSLSLVSTSTAGNSSNKRSKTLPWLNSDGWDHREWDYHPTSYFSVGPPIPRPWGPPPMMYPPCLPWAGWYGPWTPPPMHFHPGWLGPAGGFGHGGYYIGATVTGASTNNTTGGTLGKKSGWPGTPNRMVRFPQRRQKLPGSHKSNGCGNHRLLKD